MSVVLACVAVVLVCASMGCFDLARDLRTIASDPRYLLSDRKRRAGWASICSIAGSGLATLGVISAGWAVLGRIP